MGEAAQIRVRNHFLAARHLGQYIELLERVLRPADVPQAARR
jgi:hypothetical protein